jgi:uncharacterized protein YbjT (DUF2867 family)
MNQVLVVGSSGAIGQALLRKLREKGLSTRALARNEADAEKMRDLTDDLRLADARRPEAVSGLCDQIDAVISAMGKPVSLFSNDSSTFHDVDYAANSHILEQAHRRGVRRFVYISIFGSELYGNDLAIARSHRDFERLLAGSGMSHAILRPVGLFSAMTDLLRMARKGAVITLGRGAARTNPIHHEDLASLAIEQLDASENILLEAGGPDILTRWEIGEMACEAMGCDMHVRLPDLAAHLALPMLQFYDRNFFHKLAFFKTVLTRDAVAPQRGQLRLKDFLQEAAQKIRAA